MEGGRSRLGGSDGFLDLVVETGVGLEGDRGLELGCSGCEIRFAAEELTGRARFSHLVERDLSLLLLGPQRDASATTANLRTRGMI